MPPQLSTSGAMDVGAAGVWEVEPNPTVVDIGAYLEVDLGSHGFDCFEVVDLWAGSTSLLEVRFVGAEAARSQAGLTTAFATNPVPALHLCEVPTGCGTTLADRPVIQGRRWRLRPRPF